jgi:hypothetical protein
MVGVVIFVILGSVARTVDVPRTGYGIKSDEATYVAMALSLAYDGNLSYERRDLERFAGLYHQGPDGIFLKRGKTLRISVRSPFPFVHLNKATEPRADRLYYGKALAYPLFAAPFVRLFGLNGMLIFHVLLLAIVGVCAYLFLAAQSPPVAAALFATAFLGATVLPVYGVFLMPEILNVALVFVAYFLWLYKEVRPGAGDAVLSGRWTDVAAAVLLGLATYSKPVPNIFLVAPPVLFIWWRREWLHGLRTGAVAAVVAAMFFGLTAVISGEFNYQGGDRKSITATPDPAQPDFPFDGPDAAWERFPSQVATDGSAAVAVLTSPRAAHWFVHNLQYFVLGRHFGFLPYYFPGVVAIGLWLFSRSRRDVWRILIFGTFVAASLGLLLIVPFTWSGGGGPPGNRYMVSAYPMLFFLVPPLESAIPGLFAWIGGAIFTAKILVTPFESANFTWLISERGPLRRLPVELTMPNDLPVMLAQPQRGRVRYGDEPFMFLYFLDQNAWPPEPEGMWVSGAGRADIIVRTVDPIGHLIVEAESPIATVLTVSMGAEEVRATLRPRTPVTLQVPAGEGVHGRDGHAYLLSAQSSEGFVPHLVDRVSPDYRNLGAQLRFRPVAR